MVHGDNASMTGGYCENRTLFAETNRSSTLIQLDSFKLNPKGGWVVDILLCDNFYLLLLRHITYTWERQSLYPKIKNNMTELQYTKAEKISLKTNYNETWLQDIIEEDPSIIGLGELTIVERERKQSSGGKIDFLFLDHETQTMYETEIMLGSTDESHIIRTIEYWDIERRRFPSKEHKAVIIAEEITNRFFNVISLMNRSIPIIAIQLNAIKLNDHLILHFTKVLDIYEPPEDEEDLGLETVDRPYWENKSNPKSIAIVDDIIEITKADYNQAKVTYNKHHIALGTQKRNFIWFHPRKKEGYCHLEIKTGKDNLDFAKEILEEIGTPFTLRKEDVLAISLQMSNFKKHKEKFEGIIKRSLEAFS